LRETVFEKRFLHAAEMARMGARIEAEGDRARVSGVPALTGARIMASDIRAGAGLVACALSAQGETVVSRIYHIERGYERLETRLASVGASIGRFTEVRYKKVGTASTASSRSS
jgi:UDP-N-acetylglucosamine 1-carboxyvinyltransferase